MERVKEEPLVSVAIPCYNHEKYVGEAIESVLNQTYKNIELIVCDNGSQDDSYKVISGYKDRLAHFFRLEKNDEREFETRINKLMTGKYHAVLCSDDVWKPQKIERQVEIMEANPGIAACATWMALGNEDFSTIDADTLFVKYGVNRSRTEWIRMLLLGGNCLAWSSAFYRADIYFNLVRRGYSSLPDYFFWLQFLFYGNLYVVPEILGIMRWHPDGKNQNDSAPTSKSLIRTENEQADIIGWIIENMPNDLFLKTFEGDLIDSHVLEKGEIECEKFFILKRLAEGNLSLYNAVMSFFYNHFQMYNIDGDGSEKRNFAFFLRMKYQYTHRDFMEWSSRMSINSWINEKKEIEQTRSEVEKKCEILELYIRHQCSEEERAKIKREIFLSLKRKARQAISSVYQNLYKLYEQMGSISPVELESNYSLFIDVLQRLVVVIDEYYYYFELIGISEICCETWELFKELLSCARKERIDLSETVIPYLKEILGGLEGLKIPLEG